MNNFKKLGFIIPSSCTAFEFELAKLSSQISTIIGCVSRLLITDTNEDGLNQMNKGIELAAKQLATINPDVINYVCTSGSFKDGYNGNNNIKKLLKKYCKSSKVTTPRIVPCSSTTTAICCCSRRKEVIVSVTD